MSEPEVGFEIPAPLECIFELFDNGLLCFTSQFFIVSITSRYISFLTLLAVFYLFLKAQFGEYLVLRICTSLDLILNFR